MAARKITILLLIGFALLFSIISCNAETLQQATDVFEPTNDGRKMQIVTVLDKGTEYDLVERLLTQAGSAFDSCFYSNTSIEWARISYRDQYGNAHDGWIVANPDAITGIKMNAVDGSSCEEYNGYDIGFVLCESLSLRENPDVTSNTLHSLPYGAYCTVTEENDSWYNVVYRNKDGQRYNGWVRKEYVLINPNYFTPDGETPVYAIPSSSSKRIGLICSETSYPIIEEFNDFFAISLRGASGFVVKP